jgi:hypothetical protein
LIAQQKLAVSANKRFLIREDGKPFFYLGDTGWELFHKLKKSDAHTYLSNRAGKNFNVIQAVLVAEMNGLTEPNANGDVPFINLDPSKPNEKYFSHVDEIVDMAASMGLYMALLPTWGSWAMKEQHPLFKPIQFFNEDAARSYGSYLGKRYKNKKNIIWVLGGDRNPNGYETLWQAMAHALRKAVGKNHLITYHPTGGWSSSAFWHNADWLDFNMVQSGHQVKFMNSYDYIQHDYNLKPPKPTMDAETNYEDAGVSFHTSNGLFSDYDVRVSSYFSVFAGGCGITYGANSIWQMYNGKNNILNAHRTWKESLDLPGSYQMRHLKNLIESRPFLSRIPDQSILVKNKGFIEFADAGSHHMQATRDGTMGKKDATYIMVYTPLGRGIRVNTSVINNSKLEAWWYDPRNGVALFVGEFENKGVFEAPWSSLPWHNGAGPDWVLIVDDASKNYPPPGQPS